MPLARTLTYPYAIRTRSMGNHLGMARADGRPPGRTLTNPYMQGRRGGPLPAALGPATLPPQSARPDPTTPPEELP